ncbi:hypothetical protein ACFL3S_04985 [Gemmatimonadota bacterium]
MRTCTLKMGHPGPHVAHGTFRRIVAVWDKGIKAPDPEKKDRRAKEAIARKGPRNGGLIAALRAFGGHVTRKSPSMEEALLFILALSFVGFAIDWILQIFGLR